MQKTWFISDCHFGHQNIMKFHDRVFKIIGDKKIPVKDEHISVHDDMLIELWNETIAKQDVVYILGDFSFHNKQDTKKILDKLSQNKFSPKSKEEMLSLYKFLEEGEDNASR